MKKEDVVERMKWYANNMRYLTYEAMATLVLAEVIADKEPFTKTPKYEIEMYV